MACPHIPALKARVADLLARFLDVHLAAERAEPMGYTPNLDDLAAFRLLVHAEIEEYLETKAREGLATCEAAFRGGRTSVRDNVHVLVLAQVLERKIRFDTEAWEADVLSMLKAAADLVAENNGIKESSFSRLSLFSGKMPDEIDPALSASLSAFGTARGDVAHRSVSRVRTIYSPSAEAKSASDLINGLENFFS